MEKKIGDRIKELRQKASLTQAELADKMGFTSQTVSNWESGSREPDIAALTQLSSLFSVSLDYLLLGKEDESISLDDMDAEKRLSMLIKKDDAKNFIKYEYSSSAYVFGRSVTYGNYYNIQMSQPNKKTWLEIINAGAKKIFGVCCDELIKKNTQKVWAAFLVYEFLDEFVKMVVDIDRPDVLETIGFRYFAVGNKQPSRYGEVVPFQHNREVTFYINNVEAYFIQPETLEYFFISKDKSHNCFEYATSFELQIVPLSDRYGRKQYTYTHLHDKIVELAIKYKAFDALDRVLDCYKTELHNENIPECDYNGYNATYGSSLTNTYVTQNNQIKGRIFFFRTDAIESLLNAGEIEYAKKLNDYNGEALKRIKELKYDSGRASNDLRGVTHFNESELDRFIKLNSDLPEKEKAYLRCINQKILVAKEIKELRDLKLVRDILNKSYYNYYEYVFEQLSKGNLKELLKFFIDNDLPSMADALVLGKDMYPRLLKSVWETFNLKPGYEGIKSYEELEKLIVIQNPINVDNYGRIELDGLRINANEESMKLESNQLIAYIKNLKEDIYNSVSKQIDAENQAKQDAIDRAKAVNGLTRAYFEDLLPKASANSKKEQRLFILDLCSLFDAILKFDYKYSGEDFYERMNNYFNEMKALAPQSRTKDDGWGYQVPDTEYDEEVVIPEQNRINHLYDIFNRLRIQRNNIAHSETKKVQELSAKELKECLDYVFAINKEDK